MDPLAPMSDGTRNVRPRRVDGVAAGLWILGACVYVHARASLFTEGFDNPDAAGIAYNADLLLRGALPMVDSWEFKAPGAFFLFSVIFWCWRSLVAVQLVFAVWMLLGLGAVDFAVRRWRPGRPRARAMVGAAYLLSAGQFDWNYSSWMSPLYAWGGVLIIESLRQPTVRRAVGAGVAGGLALLFKKQAVMLAPLAVIAWILTRRWRWSGATGRTVIGWVLGAGLAAAPMVVFYGARGQLTPLLEGLVPISKVGAYATAMENGPPVNLAVLVAQVMAQLAQTFPLLCAAMCVTLVGTVWRPAIVEDPPGARGLSRVVALWIACSWLAGGLGGGRFYGHYLIQCLPALCLSVAFLNWEGCLGRNDGGRIGRLVLAAVLAAGAYQLVEVAAGKGDRYRGVKVRHLQDGRTAPEAVGAFIAARTSADDTIMVWGWTAWPVYYWANRRAPTRVYKALGSLTQFNTNTAFSRGGPTPFVPGPLAEEVQAAFEGGRPPAFFVLSPSFTSTFANDRDPLESFDGLVRLLQRDYRPVATFGDLTVLQRVPG